MGSRFRQLSKLGRRPRGRRSVGIFVVASGLLVGGISLAAVNVAGASGGSPGALAGNGPTAPASTPTEQMQWFCSNADTQVANGSATPFLRYASEQCKSRGASTMAAESSANGSNAPIGDFICRYAEQQVAHGTASKLDTNQARLCQIKSPPPFTGISTSPAQPPASDNVHAVTAWYGQANGQSIVVFSGSQPSSLFDGSSGNPNTGVIVEETTPTNNAGAPGSIRQATAPGSGTLSITSVSGSTLILSGANGGHFSFDTVTGSLSGS